MVRQSVQARTTFAPCVPKSTKLVDEGRAAFGRAPEVLSFLLVPFAAIAAAAAGLVFVLLLPVCGFASILGGFAAACWKRVRDVKFHPKAMADENH